uniref:neuronal pentraxin-2-like n=1 Tax=Myxine glutinosa TaxID=7769 RepID=UPI00358E6A86
MCSSSYPRALLVMMFVLAARATDQALQHQQQHMPDAGCYVCTALPPNIEASCPLPAVPRMGTADEEMRTSLIELRETILQQKETILQHRETIREMSAKLQRCENEAMQQMAPPLAHGASQPDAAIQQLDRTVQSLRERLDSLEHKHRANASGGQSAGALRELLNGRLQELDKALREKGHIAPGGPAPHRIPLLSTLSSDDFKISFPLRTNYMYARLQHSLPEMHSFSLCLWLRAAGPNAGTPFSYAVPGQPNEIALMEWGGNPMELVVNDKIAQLPLKLKDSRWHHVCVTWTTRDGVWEAFQDGSSHGSGDNLAPWRPVEAGGTIILGQEQDIIGGNFDATQAFMGEMAQLGVWNRVLTSHEVSDLASCSRLPPEAVIGWHPVEVELHGGVSAHLFGHCSSEENF